MKNIQFLAISLLTIGYFRIDASNNCNNFNVTGIEQRIPSLRIIEKATKNVPNYYKIDENNKAQPYTPTTEELSYADFSGKKYVLLNNDGYTLNQVFHGFSNSYTQFNTNKKNAENEKKQNALYKEKQKKYIYKLLRNTAITTSFFLAAVFLNKK
jgi:hypothetical protein